MQKHFLQTKPWAEFQESTGKEVLNLSGDGYSALGIIEGKAPFKRIYFPYGPSLDNKKDIKEFLIEAKQKGSELGATYLRMEPTLPDSSHYSPSELKKMGLIRFKDIQPEFTMVVDLEPSEEQIIAKMNQSTRNLHRNIHKKGIKFSESQDPADMEHLYAMLEIVSKRTGMKPHPKSYLMAEAKSLIENKKAKLFFAENDQGKKLAAAFIFTDNKKWYYSHSGSLDEARKLQIMPPLLSFIMTEAKKAGAKSFDLYGVTNPNNPGVKLASITKFKQSFGGEIVQYSGTWDLPLNKAKYFLYKLMLKIKAN